MRLGTILSTALLALFLGACGDEGEGSDEGAAGGCLVYLDGAPWTCTAYGGGGTSALPASEACESTEDGEWLSEGCPTESALGYCEHVDENGFSMSSYYYAHEDRDLDDLLYFCDAVVSGTWHEL